MCGQDEEDSAIDGGHGEYRVRGRFVSVFDLICATDNGLVFGWWI
jgi:hypothetical protein